MKSVEDYRKELDNLIIKYNYDMSNPEIVKKSLEIENKIHEFKMVLH